MLIRLNELLDLFEDNDNIEIHGRNLLMNDTKEKILENIDYFLFSRHFVKRIGLSTDWRIRPIFKIYID